MILDITENPFYILGASTRDSREKIINLANRKYSTCDVSIIDEAKENILDLNKRLYYELRWFQECDSALDKILEYINKIKKENKYFYYDVLKEIEKDIMASIPEGIFISFATNRLSVFNLSFYTFPFIDNNDKILLSDTILDLAWQQSLLGEFCDTIIDDINACREYSCLPKIIDSKLIETSFKILENDLRALILNKLNILADNEIYGIITIIQEKCKKDRDYWNTPIIKYLFSQYNDIIKIYQYKEIYGNFININENPFFVLGADITDDKRKLMNICEEKMIFENTDVIIKAQEQLLNSQKRLKAELRWFPTCSKDQIQIIINYLNDLPNKEIFEYIPNSFLEKLYYLEKINIALYSFIYIIGPPKKWSENTISKGTINKDAFYYDINKDNISLFIHQTSELYELLEPQTIKDMINEKRKISGFPVITEVNSIEEELNNLRKNIKQILSFFISNITLGKITDILINIMEYYKNGNKYHGAIIDDFISEYSLLSKDIISRRKDDIISQIEEILQISLSTEYLETRINTILSQLRNWDHLAQPLQLEALTKGMRHNESIIMANKFRELSLYCNNELKRTDLALKITKELKKYFIELTEYYQLLLEDENKLNNIKNNIFENENRIKYIKENNRNDDILLYILRFGWLGIIGIICICIAYC